MKKLIQGISVAFVLLFAVLIIRPATVYADVEFLKKDKTNKLSIGDALEDCYQLIEESLAAGKSVTYKISVPKGVLYITVTDFADFKIEIYNSRLTIRESQYLS